MSDLRVRHDFLAQLGITVWYPREPLEGSAHKVRYAWGGESEERKGQPSVEAGAGVRQEATVPVKSIVAGLKPALERAEKVAPEPERVSDVPQSRKSEAADAQASCCLGVIRAGEWLFVAESDSETALAMDLAAMRRVVEGIAGFPGWAAPEELTLVWPPLAVRWEKTGLERLLPRFLKRLEGPCRCLVFFSVSKARVQLFAKSLGVDATVFAEFESASGLIQQQSGKKALWQHLKAHRM